MVLEKLRDFVHVYMHQPVPEPRIPVDYGGVNANVIAERKLLLSKLTAKNLHDAEIVVQAKYAKELKMLMPGLRSMVPQEPTPAFWRTHYYPALFKLFAPSRVVQSSLKGIESFKPISVKKARLLDLRDE